MRRISLALALFSAVAAGCSGGSKAPSASTGTAKGVTGQYYYVNLFTPPVGGIVSSDIGGISCGASAVALTTATPPQYAYTYYAGASACGTAGQTQFQWAQTVTLTAVGQGGNTFIGWAGDCSGTGTCTLTAGADKAVIAIFGTAGGGHPNFSNPAIHGPAFASFASGDTAALQCTKCHGTTLAGQGMAPACNTCHADALTSGGHGDVAAAPWGDHSGQGWGAACQRCHTNGGNRDWTGADGTAANYLTQPYDGLIDATLTTPPVGTGYATGPLKCSTCHNNTTDPMTAGITTITFPSNVQVTTDKVTALCGQCHMARESTVSMNTLIGAVAADNQILAAGVSFKNPHYRGAAGTLFGTVAKAWAEYPGQVYTGQNQHGVSAGKCTSCHDAHSLAIVSVSATSCGRCHFNETTGAPVASLAEIEEGRQFGFEGDVDGDGVQAGLKTEILGLNAKLLAAIQAYAFNVVGQGVCFSDAAYPYFLKHTSADGTGDCTAAEIATPVAFKAFTPRLMRAAYNLKFSSTDFAAWAHNPRYAVEILFDAITDLNAGLVAAGKTAVPFAGFRSFTGHFGAAEAGNAGGMAFADWNASGFTGGSVACQQCHGGKVGYATYLAASGAPLAVTVATPVTGMQCTTCHAPTTASTNMTTIRADIANVYFPPQKAAANAMQVVVPAITTPKNFALCGTCHSGRENAATVDLSFAGKTGNWDVSFKNPHYLGAAGVMLGSDAHMMYQYGNALYAGKPVFWSLASNGNAPGPHGSPHGASCTGCHNPQATAHTFEVDPATSIPAGQTGTPKTCNGCHVTAAYGDFRLAPRKANVTALANLLYATIQAYATAAAHPVCYSTTYPYWFVDTDGNGSCSVTEAVSANGAKLDFKAAKAAFNFKWSQAEPGAYAHNYEYMAQTLIDSILDLDPSATLPVDAYAGQEIPGQPGVYFVAPGALITRP